MAKFLFVYRRDPAVVSQMSPEQMQQIMQKWPAWMGEGFQKGWMVDAGDGLKPEARFVDAKNVVTDGPFVESKDVVGGYSIVQAASIDAAAEFAKGCPVLLNGGTVEIRPLMGFTVNQ